MDYHYEQRAIESLGELMGELTWRDGTKSKSYVGYYYSSQLNDCVFFLPKVVLDEDGKLRRGIVGYLLFHLGLYAPYLWL